MFPFVRWHPRDMKTLLYVQLSDISTRKPLQMKLNSLKRVVRSGVIKGINVYSSSWWLKKSVNKELSVIAFFLVSFLLLTIFVIFIMISRREDRT